MPSQRSILMFAHHFFPEPGGGAIRAANIARALDSIGYLVHVFASPPHYPYGIVPKGYKSLHLVGGPNGVVLHRVPVVTLPYRGTFSRLLIFSSFVCFSLLSWLRFRRATRLEPSIILALNPPFFSTLIGIIVRSIDGGRLILDIGDIWPDELDVAPGRFSRLLATVAARIANVIQSKAGAFTVASSWGMKQLRPRFPGKDISLLPSGVPKSEVRRISRKESKRRIYRMIGQQSVCQLVVYTGALGYAQPVKPLLEAAKTLEDLQFVVCGSGELRPQLLDFAASLKLHNVHFLEGLDRRNLELLLNAADLCILPHAMSKWARGALPVKFFEYLGAGRAVLHYGARTEAADYIVRNNVGLFVEGFDSTQIALSIKRLISQARVLKAMEGNARILSRVFDKTALADSLRVIMETQS